MNNSCEQYRRAMRRAAVQLHCEVRRRVRQARAEDRADALDRWTYRAVFVAAVLAAGWMVLGTR